MPPNRNHPLFNRAPIQKSSINVEETISTTSATPASTTSTISIKKRNNTSYIWDHGHRSEFSSRSTLELPLTDLSAATISTAMTHLKKVHGITEIDKLLSNKSTIETYYSRSSLEKARRRMDSRSEFGRKRPNLKFCVY